jgi:glycosyltransferase involved in cell wall biosynthesis
MSDTARDVDVHRQHTPRVLFVGRGRISLPLPPWLAKKWDALSAELDLHVVNAGEGTGDRRFTLLPTSAGGFYPRLPFSVAETLRRFRPQAVVASDPYVGAAVLAARAAARADPKVIVEVHGDPRTFTRLYGSNARRVLSPVADRIMRIVLRRADATRALSPYTSSVVEELRGLQATASFPTWSDLSAFDDPAPAPIPEDPVVVFVGALEPYKNVEGLASAWRRVAAELPGARLVAVGNGSRRATVEELVRACPGQVEYHPELPPAEIVRAMDAARALVLPSWPEGLGRVVLEAFARGRGVVATDAGGIPDIVTHDRDGLLIPRRDTDALVAALLRVLRDRGLAERLGAAARETYGAWHQTPEDFAHAYRDLVDRVLAGAR